MNPQKSIWQRVRNIGLLTASVFGSEGLFGSAYLNPEISGQAIITSYSLGFPDCDRQTVDRRVSLGLGPKEKWSNMGLDSVFLVEHQLMNESDVKPFHRLASTSLKYATGRHKWDLSLLYDDSEQVLWGCAASLVTRLRREQRIREDLQVPGNRVRSQQKSLRYDYEKNGHSIGAMVTDVREQGEYGRFQSDLWLSYSLKMSQNLLVGLRGGVGDEGIRQERYRNLRSIANAAYKPFARWAIFGELGSQRRGDRQRITNWDSRVEHQFNPKILLSVASSKVVSQAGPRFSTQGHRLSVSRSSGTGNARVEVGRVEVDNPRNANNILGFGYDDQITPRHRYQFRVSDGTEFVAVIRKTRVLEGGYLFAPIPGGANNNGSSLVVGASFTKSWVNLDGRSESEVGILEIVLRGRI